ncbi:hypothetical protein [Frankia sp. Cr1]|uniref:hypothetical protein n=1 Tax=Frankia sp. Cr1 TaxID=3073931 RepID=UPI002AD25004|nr:hypothetical protein [Frankia sp. Cr1]
MLIEIGPVRTAAVVQRDECELTLVMRAGSLPPDDLHALRSVLAGVHGHLGADDTSPRCCPRPRLWALSAYVVRRASSVARRTATAKWARHSAHPPAPRRPSWRRTTDDDYPE